MVQRVVSILLLVSLELPAQQSAQRSKASDYARHYRLPAAEIGAEYLPRGVPGGKAASAGKGYLVAVGVFPSTKAGITISRSQFSLHVDGEKAVLRAQPPGTSPALKESSVDARPNSSAQSGSVQLGGPPITGRSASNNTDSQLQMPRSPIPLDSNQNSEAGRSDQSKSPLAEGPTTKPVQGYLLFRFDGDPKSIRSLELVYDTGGNGPKARIKLI